MCGLLSLSLKSRNSDVNFPIPAITTTRRSLEAEASRFYYYHYYYAMKGLQLLLLEESLQFAISTDTTTLRKDSAHSNKMKEILTHPRRQFLVSQCDNGHITTHDAAPAAKFASKVSGWAQQVLEIGPARRQLLVAQLECFPHTRGLLPEGQSTAGGAHRFPHSEASVRRQWSYDHSNYHG